jgi:hypothetical protein
MDTRPKTDLTCNSSGCPCSSSSSSSSSVCSPPSAAATSRACVLNCEACQPTYPPPQFTSIHSVRMPSAPRTAYTNSHQIVCKHAHTFTGLRLERNMDRGTQQNWRTNDAKDNTCYQPSLPRRPRAACASTNEYLPARMHGNFGLVAGRVAGRFGRRQILLLAAI